MNTVEGGIYKDAVGDGYHDANGKAIHPRDVDTQLARAEALSRESVAQFAVPQSQSATDPAQSLANALVTALGQRNQAPDNPPPTAPQQQASADDDTTNLTAETERRARTKSS